MIANSSVLIKLWNKQKMSQYFEGLVRKRDKSFEGPTATKNIGFFYASKILPRWQDTICMYGLVLVSCDFMLCRCTPRIRPWATTIFCIYVSSVNHRQISPGLSAAICRRYAALCRFVAYQLFQWAHHTPVMSELTTCLVLWKRHGTQPIQIWCYTFWHCSTSKNHVFSYFCQNSGFCDTVFWHYQDSRCYTWF